jgi:hypothetical protein
MNAVRFVLAIALLATASPAAAQWTRITALPITNVFSVWSNGDTIAAGVDTATYVSTNAGVTWKRSAKVAANVAAVDAAIVRNGHLYAATFGQGVFVSDDLGDTWQPFSQGLTGGFLDSQLKVDELVVRGDSLYAATSGAGVYVRSLLAGGWSHFGEAFEPNQASNTVSIATDGKRLLVSAGANGSVFFRDRGDADWTQSWLDNAGLEPGLSALAQISSGTSWFVGTNVGVFVSPLGQEPWTFVDVGLGTLSNVAFAMRGHVAFGAFTKATFTTFTYSGNDGAGWSGMEMVPAAFVFKMATSGDDLYAAQTNGLWRRSITNVGVAGDPAAPALQFAVAGSQPANGNVRFRFVLPRAGNAAIEVFDVSGRRVATIEQTWDAGAHEVAWETGRLPSGVYSARLSAVGLRKGTRVVLAR